MKTNRLIPAVCAVGSLLMAATLHAQGLVLTESAGGVTVVATQTDSPGEGFSAWNISASSAEGTKIVTIEGLNLEDVHQVSGSFSPPGEGFRNAAGPLYNEAWLPFDSALSFPKENIAGGVVTHVETNDNSRGRRRAATRLLRRPSRRPASAASVLPIRPTPSSLTRRSNPTASTWPTPSFPTARLVT